MVSGTAQRHNGQAMVLFALGLVAAIAMVGLVIDGGNAYAQQRGTQNASDSAAEAGATTIARSLLLAAVGTTTTSAQLDAKVLAALNGAAQDNGIKPFDYGVAGNSTGYYTDILGNMLTSAGATTTSTASAVQVGSGSVPPCAAQCIGGRAVGVLAFGQRDFATYLSGVVGITSLRSTAQATAVSGYAPPTACTAAEGCILLPVTFGTHSAQCTGTAPTNSAVFDPAEWGFLPQPQPVRDNGNPPSNEIILSLCQGGAGAFGWLDFGCGNIADQISSPCNLNTVFPSWLQTQPGNPNNVEDELNAYAGNIVGTYESGPAPMDQVVQIPFFDAICHANSKPPDNTPLTGSGFPKACVGDDPSGGNNTYYHIPFFLGFILDHAYVQGQNQPECNQNPGSPKSGGNGAIGCFKGWASVVVSQPGPVTPNPGAGGSGTPLRIQLIK